MSLIEDSEKKDSNNNTSDGNANDPSSADVTSSKPGDEIPSSAAAQQQPEEGRVSKAAAAAKLIDPKHWEEIGTWLGKPGNETRHCVFVESSHIEASSEELQLDSKCSGSDLFLYETASRIVLPDAVANKWRGNMGKSRDVAGGYMQDSLFTDSALTHGKTVDNAINLRKRDIIEKVKVKKDLLKLYVLTYRCLINPIVIPFPCADAIADFKGSSDASSVSGSDIDFDQQHFGISSECAPFLWKLGLMLCEEDVEFENIDHYRNLWLKQLNGFVKRKLDSLRAGGMGIDFDVVRCMKSFGLARRTVLLRMRIKSFQDFGRALVDASFKAEMGKIHSLRGFFRACLKLFTEKCDKVVRGLVNAINVPPELADDCSQYALDVEECVRHVQAFFVTNLKEFFVSEISYSSTTPERESVLVSNLDLVSLLRASCEISSKEYDHIAISEASLLCCSRPEDRPALMESPEEVTLKDSLRRRQRSLDCNAFYAKQAFCSEEGFKKWRDSEVEAIKRLEHTAQSLEPNTASDQSMFIGEICISVCGIRTVQLDGHCEESKSEPLDSSVGLRDCECVIDILYPVSELILDLWEEDSNDSRYALLDSDTMKSRFFNPLHRDIIDITDYSGRVIIDMSEIGQTKGGFDKWYKLENRSPNLKYDVEVRISLKTPEIRIVQSPPQDYHGLYRMLVRKLIVEEVENFSSDGIQEMGLWRDYFRFPGTSTLYSCVIMDQFALRYGVGGSFQKICLLESCAELYEKGGHVDIFILENLLLDFHGLDENSVLDLTTQEAEILCNCLENIFEFLLSQLIKFSDCFPKGDPFDALKSTIYCLKYCLENHLYKLQHPHFPSIEGLLVSCLRKGAVEVYGRISAGFSSSHGSKRSHTDVEAENFIGLIRSLCSEIDSCSIYFELNFDLILNDMGTNAAGFDFILIFVTLYDELFATDLGDFFQDMSTCEVSTVIFDLYFGLKSMINKFESISAKFSSKCPICEWFSPYVLKWLESAGKNIQTWVQLALESDSLSAEPGSVHSTSVIDVFSAFYQNYEFLNSLDWEDVKTLDTFKTHYFQMVSFCLKDYGDETVERFLKKGPSKELHADKLYTTIELNVERLSLSISNLETTKNRLVEFYDFIGAPDIVNRGVENSRRKSCESDSSSRERYDSVVESHLKETLELLGQHISQLIDIGAFRLEKYMCTVTYTLLLTFSPKSPTFKGSSLSDEVICETGYNLNASLEKFLDLLKESNYHPIFKEIAWRSWCGTLDCILSVLVPSLYDTEFNYELVTSLIKAAHEEDLLKKLKQSGLQGSANSPETVTELYFNKNSKGGILFTTQQMLALARCLELIKRIFVEKCPSIANRIETSRKYQQLLTLLDLYERPSSVIIQKYESLMAAFHDDPENEPRPDFIIDLLRVVKPNDLAAKNFIDNRSHSTTTDPRPQVKEENVVSSSSSNSSIHQIV
eukprot:Nk52_evm67s485 gene=Nk52_evmTU67s485